MYPSFLLPLVPPSATNKIKSNLAIPHSNPVRHFYFNRLLRLWNSLPPLDLDLPYFKIKKFIMDIYWDYFLHTYSTDITCTWFRSCPCNNCMSLPWSTSWTLTFRIHGFCKVFNNNNTITLPTAVCNMSSTLPVYLLYILVQNHCT